MVNPRAQYSSIIARPELKLPEGARLVIWPVINVEEWDINEPMARAVLPSPQNVNVVPDVANFGWFDYGLRIGFWRLKEVLDRHKIRATVSLNASICNSYPEIVQRSLDEGWEMLAHSFIQRVINNEQNERETIQRSIRTIEEFTGEKVRGWMGPGLAETFHTPDILAEEGIEYVADWCNDDQPYELKVKTGRLVALPYTLELNDIPIYIIQHHRSSEIFERARDQFDTLYRESIQGARIMCISTHPYISGVPHRIKYYEMIFDYVKKFEGVVFMTGSEILDWYNSTL
tara:strand:+ start:843 stop:1706 length:864 start_codon:yes stop_codon:yes gene_type:complete